MAGLGFKDFQVGEVLTSSDVDGYLMQQSVMRFADSAARGSALGTAPGTAVALAEGMVSYLDDLNQVQVYTGTAWQPAGKFSQIEQTVKTDTFTTTSTSFVDVTGLTVSITPTSATNKVLVIASFSMSSTGAYPNYAALARGGTVILQGDAAGSRVRTSVGVRVSGASQDFDPQTHSVVYLDSPATTSSTTYSVQVSTNNASNTVVINRSGSDTDSNVRPRTASTITAIEVAA